MKKIILILALVASWTTFAQKSEYNANNTLDTKEQIGFWFNANNSEGLIYEQNTVGFFNSSLEIKKVLAFYSLDFNKPFTDKTLLDSHTTIDDYKSMSLDLLLKNAVVFKIWHTETHIINWSCNNKYNGIVITPKQK